MRPLPGESRLARHAPAGRRPRGGGARTIATACLVVALAMLLPTTPAAAAAQSDVRYTHVKLSLPPVWTFYDASVLSEDGRAGGYVRVSNDTDPIDVPTIWDSAGHPTPAPVLGSYRQGYISGFTPAGVGIGLLYTPPAFPPPAGIFTNKGFQPLPDFGRGGSAKAANYTTICGETYFLQSSGFFESRATIWDASGARLVTGIPDVKSGCFAINSSGVYVGGLSLRAPGGGIVNRGFIGRDGSGEVLEHDDYEITRANDINGANLIIGQWTPDGGLTPRGFLAEAFGDEIVDLGLLAGFDGVIPRAINDSGEIVGSASQGGTGARALYWPAGATQPTDLNTLVDLPGVTLLSAMDINNAGQILTRGTGGYYILTPVPEPATAAALAVAGLVARRRRR